MRTQAPPPLHDDLLAHYFRQEETASLFLDFFWECLSGEVTRLCQLLLPAIFTGGRQASPKMS